MNERASNPEFSGKKVEREPLHPYEVREIIKISQYLRELGAYDRASRNQLPPYPIFHEVRADLFKNDRTDLPDFGEDLGGVKRMLHILKEQKEAHDEFYADNKDVIEHHLGITTENINKAMEVMDQFYIWSHKFRTGEREEVRARDSIYYQTKNGSSIRFKLACIDEGLDQVIQPFCDQIYFSSSTLMNVNKEGRIVAGLRASQTVAEPTKGKYVHEYLSKKFYDLQTGTEEYNDEPAQEVWAVDAPNDVLEIHVNNMYGDHFGHKVNHLEELQPGF